MPNTSTPAKKKTAGTRGNQLEQFFMDTLRDLYWAEKHLLKALPKMQKAATSPELQAAIEEHTAQTEEHVNRLEQAFQMMGYEAKAKKCDAMDGLIKEGETIVEETEDGSFTRDVGIIAAAQKVEHYEIASYGTLVQLAMTIGQPDVAELLTQTLEEEKQTDVALTELAENNINQQAEEEDEGMEEE